MVQNPISGGYRTGKSFLISFHLPLLNRLYIYRTFKIVSKSTCVYRLTSLEPITPLMKHRVAAFAWSQESIRAMLEPATGPSPDDAPGGTVLFTGATSSTRGAAAFATFAAGKHGLRALSQSLAREFGKQNIHVAHVIIDGTILTAKIKQMFGGKKQVAQTPGEVTGDENWLEDDTRRLDPTSIAKVSSHSLGSYSPI